MGSDPSQLPTLSLGSSDPPVGVPPLPASQRRGKWVRRHRVGMTVGIVVIVLVAFTMLLWRGAAWLNGSNLHGLTPDQRQTAIDAMRGRLLQLGAGLVLAGGLIYTGLNFRLSREGHVTDRYTKAIEQLGSGQVDVRLGAIYALERIMLNSERDHPTIVEVLAAFIREHSRINRPNVGAAGAGLVSTPPNHSLMRLATDVQAALTVLGRRPSKGEEQRRLDLRQTNLVGADLSYADLNMALLYQANLTGADLTKAFLIEANLAEAVLIGVHIWNAKLSGANLNGADLTGAELGGVDLVKARLLGANLTGAFMTGSDFSSAIFNDANLRGAIMVEANLMQARLTKANLVEAKLYLANLTAASLESAQLNQANLNQTNLSGALLLGADLTGAILTKANFTDADLTGAVLCDTDLTEATLTGAHLTGADLTGARLDGVDLTGVDTTDAVLPAGHAGGGQAASNT